MKLKSKVQGEMVQLRLLIKHPMKIDKKGKPIKFIETVNIHNNDKLVFSSYIGAGVSKDPYFKLKIKGKSGDQVKVDWVDNKGDTENETFTIK